MTENSLDSRDLVCVGGQPGVLAHLLPHDPRRATGMLRFGETVFDRWVIGATPARKSLENKPPLGCVIFPSDNANFIPNLTPKRNLTLFFS
ncbi:unnamed protein product [Notodromas monacha]|uniref:Uncharacterized protein n=1 Tax=Notodromas monacha TaxID=399045 RepID=A0A7R9C348_9CRUS|nr:unnamed protein product [Notodromas monacha]CAG0925433.1 unnamed protein product [Notodromas monacha]